jgi:hypothetical protein
VLLAWKTCARWDEIQQLTGEQFVQVTPSRIIINWGYRTKATRLNPYRPDNLTVVTGPWTAEIAASVLGLRPSERLIALSTGQLYQHMQKLFHGKYSVHSIKHGAANALAQLAAAGQLTLQQVQLLAKHRSLETTLRYITDHEAAALALGTQHVTALL